MYGIMSTMILLENYGPKELDYLKQFSAKIESATLTATQTPLKKLCMEFYQEVFKWIGADLMNEVFIKNLKEIQKKQLNKYFES